MNDLKTSIIDSLVSVGVVKLGEFTLKSGIKSPIYLDLRLIISYPELLSQIGTSLADVCGDLDYDRIAGIPYTALPIATAFSLMTQKPMIYCRKEIKSYGTGNRIEGVWHPGEKVLIIDDLITDGGSKFETFGLFEDVGLKISDTVVLVDREQGGKERLQAEGYRLFSILSIFEILDRMKETNHIDHIKQEEVLRFLESTRSTTGFHNSSTGR